MKQLELLFETDDLLPLHAALRQLLLQLVCKHRETGTYSRGDFLPTCISKFVKMTRAPLSYHSAARSLAWHLGIVSYFPLSLSEASFPVTDAQIATSPDLAGAP